LDDDESKATVAIAPGTKLILIMLESAVLLKEIIKTSDHSAAWVVGVKGHLSNF
jgi:hypothetical protein